MRRFLLFCSFVTVVASVSRFQSTVVMVNVVLRCKNSWRSKAEVFLMEKDFSDNAFDADDRMDFGKYEFGVVPELKLKLRGEEFEMTGLEPYLRIVHPCTNRKGTFKTIIVPLMEGMYKSRTFEVVINLDSGRETIISSVMFP